ncbi:MAG TPA: pilus assembly PilX N-terminal domain-containing protein, partial [Planctomycetota bacterium]|nr:pilus assembly PilX N-terminal domain-containing protein [Planctomycetota bacterium]
MTIKDNKSGIVLIVILGVLALLVILGTVFSMLTTFERATSKRHVDYVQAKLVAQSGIHYAMSTAKTYLAPDKIDGLKYYGEDLDPADGDKPASQEENQDGDGTLQTFGCPLVRAVHPTLMKDLNNDGKINTKDLIEIKKGAKQYQVGISGRIPSQYNKDGNYFALKIDDLSSRLYVNMEDHSHLKQILENLTEEIGIGRDVGARIFDEKAKNGNYTSLDELKARVRLSDDDTKKLEPYITFYDWCDTTVVSPTPLSGRLGRDGAKPVIDSDIQSWSEMRIAEAVKFPKKNDKVVGRAPININTAPKQLVIALIRDLKGFYLQAIDRDSSSSDNYVTNNEWTIAANRDSQNYALHQFPQFSAATFKLKETTAFSRETATKIVEQIAKRIGTEGPFRNWQQFHDFCDSLTTSIGLTKTEADILKANFNPNTNLNDFNPDANRLLRVDKTDLTYYTTEFTFYATGYYEITSLGRVLNNNNKVLAQAEIKSIVKLFDIYRETAESQFLADIKDKPIKNNIIAENANPSKPTHNDLTLQVLPEINNKDAGVNANYDGYIAFATIEQPNPLLDGATLRFRASFTNGLDANTSQEIRRFRTEPVPGAGKLIPASETASEVTGRLYPDGVYSDSKAIPAYFLRPGDFNDQLIVVSMWIKPHFYPEETGKIRTYFSWMNTTANNEIYDRPGVPFGIYSIARLTRNDILSCRAEGDGWNHNSFLAGGYGTSNAIGFTGAGTPCLNHTNHTNCSGISNPPEWSNSAFRAGKWINITWVRRVQETSAMINNSQPLKYALAGNKLYVFADGSSYKKEDFNLAACPHRDGGLPPPKPPVILPPPPIEPPKPPVILPPPPIEPPKPPVILPPPPIEPPKPPVILPPPIEPPKPPVILPPPIEPPKPPVILPPPPAIKPDTNDMLYINGQAWPRGSFQDQSNAMIGKYNTSDNYLRLGEVLSALRLNGAPDATIDEVLVFELTPGTQGGGSSNDAGPDEKMIPPPPIDPDGSVPSAPNKQSVDNNTFIIDENIKLCSLNSAKVTYTSKEKIIWASCPSRKRDGDGDWPPPPPPPPPP